MKNKKYYVIVKQYVDKTIVPLIPAQKDLGTQV